MALVFANTMAARAPPGLLVTFVDSSRVSFDAQVANFGDQFQDSFTYEAVVMLPPDDATMCNFPSSLYNMTVSESQNLSRSIALMVARGDCPFDQKARVMLEMQEKLTSSLQYLIVYNHNASEPDQSIVMSTSANRTSLSDLDRIGAMFISTHDAELMIAKIRLYSNQTGLDYTFLSNASRNWDLQIKMEVGPPQVYGGSGSTSSNDQGSSTATFYWLRFVLFALLILSPCIRAGYLWYSGGGRILFRRNEQGRVVGLQYVRPMPYWFATGAEMRMGHAEHQVTVLTEDQVLALPELVYKSARDVERDEPDNEANTTATKESKDSELESAEVEKADDETSEEKIDHSSIKEVAADGKDCDQEICVELSSDAGLTTTCTMCSICIDEFEDGETIRVLPKCKHGFHFDCIKPWLTERQSCCPLCKTNVLTPDGVDHENNENQDSPA